MNKPQWVYAEVDLDLIAKVRGFRRGADLQALAGAARCGALPKAQVVDISGSKAK